MSIYTMQTVDVPSYTETASDSYTKLLLHCDGANGSTTFTDKTGKTVNVIGNSKISTTQKKFGSASVLFDTTSFLEIPYTIDFDFGNSNFTIDFWLYPVTMSQGYELFRLNRSTSASAYSGIGLNSNSTDGLQYVISYNGISWAYTNTISSGLSMNTWNHVAVVRNGSNIVTYINGVATGLTANVGTSSLYGGDAEGKSTFGGNGMYIDEFRISKGIARWTSNFTPPTAPYDTTITQPPTNVNVKVAKVYRSFSGVNRDIKQIDRSYSGVNRLVFGDAKTYLYKDGDEFTTLTGGFVSLGAGSSASYYNLFVKNTTNLYQKGRATSLYGGAGIWKTANPIDLSPFTTLKVQFDGHSGGDKIQLQIAPTGAWSNECLAYSNYTNGTYVSDALLSLDVSALNSSYVVGCLLQGNTVNGEMWIKKMWLE